MLGVAAMSSTHPENWKRPWTEENERPAITLPDPTKSLYARDRQTLDQFDAGHRDSIPSLKRHVDPEDRSIQAMPKSSTDVYTKYLLSQDSTDNSTKRMKMSSNPWLDLKGKGHDSIRLDRTVGQDGSKSADRPSMIAPQSWTPMPMEAARPRDISSLYASTRTTPDTDTCGTCDKATYIAPNIARGLQRLQEQLKFVVAKGRNNAAASPESISADRQIPDDLVGALEFSMDKLNDNIRIVKEMLFSVNLEDGTRALRPVYEDERYGNRSEDGNRDRATSREPFARNMLSGSPSRQLPSPNSLSLSSVLPGVSPKASNVSTTTAHLQDLQHQLSTRSLAHQVLQSEHEKLLANFSKIQARYSSLEKKQHMADSELNNCIEERAGLLVQVETLEQQIIDLQTSKDEAQKQSVANGSQYMQIMAMSSKLQTQGAADLKKYKADRDIWASEKADLETKVKLLKEAQGTASIFASVLAASGKSVEAQNAADETELATMSFDRLKEEILTLRRNVREASTVIQTMREEGSAITKLTNELGAAGERLIKLGVKSAKTDDQAMEP